MDYFDIHEYMADNDDLYAPPTPKILLQQLDNYQIYSIILCEYPSISNGIKKVMIPSTSGGDSVIGGLYTSSYFSYVSTESFNNPPAINDELRFIEATKMIAFQRFGLQKVPINFDDIARKINVTPNDVRVYKYVASTSAIKTTSDTLPNGPAPPNIQTEYYGLTGPINSGGLAKYRYVRREHSTTTPGPLNTTAQATSSNTYTLFEDTYTIVGASAPPLLDMYALIAGYAGDSRILADDYPSVVPNVTGELSIKYYRQNQLEAVPNVISIDWLTYNISLTKGKRVRLPIIKPVFGTLIIDGANQLVSDIKTQLSVPESNRYRWSDYFLENIDSTVNMWEQIHSNYTLPPAPPDGLTVFENVYTQYLQPLNKLLSANNNYWDNDPTNYPDIDISNTNPQYGFTGQLPRVLSDDMLSSNGKRQKAYEWHIEPQVNGSFGRLIMEGPRTIEIHAAINAGKWAINPDDPTTPRKDDLGWRIQRTNEVLGIRVGTDGKFNPDKEKTLVRQVIASNKNIDAQKVGVNNFGTGGMVVKRINNRFNGDKIESDQCVIVHDVLQLIQEYHEQHNLAVGLQESSAIEIKDGKSKARFDNQLGLLVEIFNLLSSANEMTRSALISSLVTQSQTNELIAGLGLPSVTKTIPIEIDKKVTQLPYKGIAPHRSISQEVATCTANVGIVLGQLI